jgi:hypothetical protein
MLVLCVDIRLGDALPRFAHPSFYVPHRERSISQYSSPHAEQGIVERTEAFGR